MCLGAALIPACWLGWQSRAQNHLGMMHDDALYVVSAKALADGNGYRIGSLPGEPWQTKYPPLFPALIAVVWKVFPKFPANLLWMGAVGWLGLIAFLWQTWETYWDENQPIWLTAVVAASPVVAIFTTTLMSELLFTAFVLASFRFLGRGRPGIAGFIGGLAFLTRTAGMPLLISAPIVQWLRGDRRGAMRFAGAMGPFVQGWAGWCAYHRTNVHGLYTYYLDYFGYYLSDVEKASLPWLVWSNLDESVKGMMELFVFDRELNFLTLTLIRVLAIMTVAGVIKLVREGRFQHYGAFGVLYIVQLLVWNYPPTSRFALPLFPLLAAGAWREFSQVVIAVQNSLKKSGLADRAVGILASVALLTLLGWATTCNVRGVFGGIAQAYQRRARALEESRTAFEWISVHDGFVLSYEDPLVFLYTGRKSISLRLPPAHTRWKGEEAIRETFTELPQHLTEHHVAWVLERPLDFSMDAPVLSVPLYQATIGNWPVAFSSGNVRIRQVHRDGP